MIPRKIQAPGVEVNEIDVSQYNGIDLTDTTVFLLNGFSDKGDDEVTKIVTSMANFTTAYGHPTTEAERYLYNGVRQTLLYGGIPAITKLPYDNKAYKHFSYCTYKVGKKSESLEKVGDNANISAFFPFEVLSGDTEILDNSRQVELFENFINGICDFGSYGLSQEVLDEINSTLFGNIYCLSAIKSILEYEYTDPIDTMDPNDVIYHALEKNGYADYDKFLHDLNATMNKDSCIECIETLSSIPDEDSFPDIDLDELLSSVLSLEYSDLANVNEMDSFIRITADENALSLMGFDEYDKYLIGDSNKDDDTIKIVDITRGKYEKDKLAEDEELSSREYLGIVPVLMTAPNALWYQNIIEHSSSNFRSYNIVSEISASTNLVPLDHVEVPISAVSENGNSLGRVAAGYFPKIEYFSPTSLDNTLFHKVGVVVFKMGIDTANSNMISLTPVEAFVGSLNRKEKDLITNTTDFLEDIVNNQSNFINLFVNISDSTMKECLKASTFIIENQPAFSLGFSSVDCEKNISVKLLEDSLQLIFDKLQNPNLLKIDVVADCGTSNIAQYIANTTFNNVGKFDIVDSYNFQIKNRNSIQEWRRVIDLYDDFCRNVRKDCMFIADSPRNFCLLGNQKIVRRSNPQNTIENSILPSLRFMVDFNTSYGAGYCNWFRCIDDTTRYYMWMPPTVKVIEAYLRTDNQYNFWEAPAGSRRGIMSETYDVAFNPSEKDAEKIYINRWNYAVSFPLEGILLEGQKTFQRNQTAFDRVNVRRLFLRIEKDVKRMARTFLYEGITERNMMRFRDMVNTYLQDIQTKDGIRDFYVICDGRNNTNETVDNNEMHCSIGIMPVKSLEFIILNFICTTQSANVEEVTSQYI